MPISWIEYQGKNILYVDYQGLSGPALIQTLEAAFQTVTQSLSGVLVLNNFTNAILDAEFMMRAKELGQPVGERKSLRTAAVGVGGLKTILLQGYNRTTDAGIMPFDTIDEALIWLVHP